VTCWLQGAERGWSFQRFPVKFPKSHHQDALPDGLVDDAEWSTWPDNAIAKQCGVSHPFVGKVRVSLETLLVTTEKPTLSSRTYKTKSGTVSTMKTGAFERKKHNRKSILTCFRNK